LANGFISGMVQGPEMTKTGNAGHSLPPD